MCTNYIQKSYAQRLELIYYLSIKICKISNRMSHSLFFLFFYTVFTQFLCIVCVISTTLYKIIILHFTAVVRHTNK